MKRLTALIALAALALPLPAMARYGQRGYSGQCFESVYREEYIPGTERSPGRVKRWTERVEVSCYGGGETIIHEDPFPMTGRPPRRPVDDNSCIEGTIIGGILGGAGGAAASRGKDMAWAIPLGVVAGGMVGCAADGG